MRKLAICVGRIRALIKETGNKTRTGDSCMWKMPITVQLCVFVCVCECVLCPCNQIKLIIHKPDWETERQTGVQLCQANISTLRA